MRLVLSSRQALTDVSPFRALSGTLTVSDEMLARCLMRKRSLVRGRIAHRSRLQVTSSWSAFGVRVEGSAALGR
jgi:hypothetical protein